MNDNEIVERLFNRSESVLDEIRRRYEKTGITMSRNITGSDSDAEECMNDAYLRIWNSIPPARPDNFGAYFYRTVRNLSLNKKRDNEAHRKGVVDSPDFELLLELIPSEDENCLKLGELINEFLMSVNQSTRLLFVRRYYYCDSLKTLSELSGLGENNIAKKLSRTRKALRKYLEERGVSI